MTLEFNQVVEQVYRMSAMIEKLDFNLTDLYKRAFTLFRQIEGNDAVWERIRWVRQSDISGYRGATPLNSENAERVTDTFAPPPPPPRATLIAVDGSQIYPNEFSPVHYYLTNIGIYVYPHGSEQTPEQYTYPELKFHRAHVHDKYGRLIGSRTVDDRRTILEMERLAAAAWQRRNDGLPLVALYDNRLMYLPANDTDDSSELMKAFLTAMQRLHASGATLAGYIDNPHRSKRFIQLLYLMSVADEDDLKAKRHELSKAGDLDGLGDRMFFEALLENGQRSALMVQNSPQNKDYHDYDPELEIAFFYLKVFNAHDARVVRVDVPMWVARDKARVDVLHALLLYQCQLQGRTPYPYAITRADELAWVSHKDAAKLEEMIHAQVRRVKGELVTRTITAKMRGKELARSSKRTFDMRGEEIIDER